MMQIRALTPAVRRQWDVFVTQHPDGTFFHKSGWQSVFARSLGYATRYLYMEDEGVITGVLPLVHVKSWLFGSALISTAFCVYGGPLANDADTATALRAAAVAEME